MSFPVDPSRNLGHASWSLADAPAGEADADHKVFWRCDRCGFVVGFWRAGFGSAPTSDETAPPDNVGVFVGSNCG